MRKQKSIRVMEAISLAVSVITILILVIWPPMDAPEPNPEEEPYTPVKVQVLKDTPKVIHLSTVECQQSEFKPTDEIGLYYDDQLTLHQLCKENNVPMAYALAIIETESNFRYDAVGSLGEVGLFQIHPINWELFEAKGVDVNTAKGNIEAGVTILAECLNKCKELDASTMYYKCGPSRAQELMLDGVRLKVCDRVALLTMYYEGILNENASEAQGSGL